MGNTLFKHIFFEEIDSTSSYLIKEHNNLENFTFVSTNYQSKGKGRENRQWISVSSTNLLFSFLLKDKALIKEYGSISLLCASIIAEYFISKGIKGVQIKWPNDIYINGKKAVGILLEGNVEEYLVVGIGINVNQKEFPDNLHHPATSLLLEEGKEFSVELLKKDIFNLLLTKITLDNIRNKSYLGIVNDLNYLKDKIVFATIANYKVKVKVIKVDADNSLVVKYNGKLHNIISGEIEFV